MSDVPARLLRDTLRAAMEPAASSGCIDTETLAAWADGTLNARERRWNRIACVGVCALPGAACGDRANRDRRFFGGSVETVAGVVSQLACSARRSGGRCDVLGGRAGVWPEGVRAASAEASAPPPASTAELGRVSKNEAAGLPPSAATKQRRVAPANTQLPQTSVAGNAVAPMAPRQRPAGGHASCEAKTSAT